MELSEAIEVSRVDDVFMRMGPRPAQIGSLVLIGHHLIFAPQVQSPPDQNEENSNEEFWLLHRTVDRVIFDPIAKDNPSKGGVLTLKCKNFMICIFEILSLEDGAAVARSIQTLSNLNDFTLDYPFFYRCPFTVLDNGWSAFDTQQEFSRLAVRVPDSFRISEVNRDFKVCPTYPERVIVPRGIGDDYLKISATFRDGGRFPVLSYYHQPTKSSIVRCAQPLIGPTNRRCKEDETILNSLLTQNRGYIIDTRNKTIAQNSRSKGGGCESQMYYSQWKYVNCGTPRIREIHDSLAKLVEICNDQKCSSDRWISKLSSSGWLSVVSDCLNAAANVAQCVACEGTASEVPVVVHGGEGLDTTLLVTSLAQILLDPDARTIRGFEGLIEREWVGAGHPFKFRNAHSAYAEGSITGPQESPVFLVFLDCVWQVYAQYSHSFEFTEEFLIFLFEHSYASEFGTFLSNNEMEKLSYRVKLTTVSLWSYVNNPEILRTFVNTLYEPNSSVLWPSVAPQSIRLWDRLFLRWQREWTEVSAIQTAANQWKMKEKELQSRAFALRRQLMELSKDAHLQNSMLRMSIAE